MDLIKDYREAVKSLKNNKSYYFYEMRLFTCFKVNFSEDEKECVDLIFAKTAKEAESLFREKYSIHLREPVKVPFRINFMYMKNEYLDTKSDEELKNILKHIEFLSTKHTERDYAYYNKLLCHTDFWWSLLEKLAQYSITNIYCNEDQYEYFEKAFSVVGNDFDVNYYPEKYEIGIFDN